MCGILCEILFTPNKSVIKDVDLLQRLKNRGPNCIHSHSIKLNDHVEVFFCGAVLWTQGPNLTLQPMEDDKGVLLFNGDIFDPEWNKNYSDTETIMEKLQKCDSSDITRVIKSLKGPFCIIYFEKLTKSIYFARDRIGRGSLLLYKSGQCITISSVLGRKYPCIEIPALNIYKLNIECETISTFTWNLESSEKHSVHNWIQDIQKQQNLSDDEFISFKGDKFDLSEQDDIINYIERISKAFSCKQSILKELLTNETITKTVKTLLHLLDQSMKIRIESQPNKCKNCLNGCVKCSHCTVGILFSGGLDCTILAFLADKYVPKDQPIDLINVAFKTENVSYNVPDRITGRQSYEELRRICCSRNWVFREVNVERNELESCQSSKIADLVYPRRTILDESLGSALWYAAWGCDDRGESPCRVLILGSGADELFGGYTRHRNAYKRQGWSGLAKELMLDWDRISFRNLARDNRVICDHGRIPRLPYLDEEFSTYVLNLKPWLKCFPSEHLGNGIGDKLMLRLIAMHLGLTDVATLPKRALQFGTRIANKKQKGSDLSKYLL